MTQDLITTDEIKDVTLKVEEFKLRRGIKKWQGEELGHTPKSKLL